MLVIRVCCLNIFPDIRWFVTIISSSWELDATVRHVLSLHPLQAIVTSFPFVICGASLTRPSESYEVWPWGARVHGRRLAWWCFALSIGDVCIWLPCPFVILFRVCKMSHGGLSGSVGLPWHVLRTLKTRVHDLRTGEGDERVQSWTGTILIPALRPITCYLQS